MKRKVSIIIYVLLFCMFLILYLTNNINGFDEYFYNLIINLRSDSMTTFMKFITFFASTKFIIVLLLIFLIGYFIKKKKLFLIIDGIILGEVLLNNIIKLLIGRERPELEHLVTETSYSFPSGHTMVSVVLYGHIMYLINKCKIDNKIKIVLNIFCSLLIILIMMSRIYLGVHFASDVFAGMCLSSAYLIFIIDLLERRKML